MKTIDFWPLISLFLAFVSIGLWFTILSLRKRLKNEMRDKNHLKYRLAESTIGLYERIEKLESENEAIRHQNNGKKDEVTHKYVTC